MTTSYKGRTSQLAMLLAAPPGAQVAAKVTQVVLLIAAAPPESERAQVSQAAMLIASTAEGKVEANVTQVVMLVAKLTGIADPARSRAWAFTLDGHEFYVLNLGAQGTFLWDTVTSQWCKFVTNGYGQWNFTNGCQWGNRVVGGDLLTDQVWELRPTALLDEGWRDINHVVTGGIATRSRVYVSCDNLRVAGSIGLLDELNGATMTLRYSDDQEATWSDPFTIQLTEDEFDGEIAWRSLGSFMAPGRIFELSDIGGLIRIDGADAFLNGFDNDQQSQE